MPFRLLRILAFLFLCSSHVPLLAAVPPAAELNAYARGTADLAPPPGDQISQGLWWLYHLDYEKAHSLFAGYAQQHRSDPAGYFYMTATDWWQLAQQFDMKLPEIEKRLEIDYQAVTIVAEGALHRATNDHERALACLYWGGAEGLKGRWLVAKKDYVKAYFLGNRGNKLLHNAIQYDPTLYDAYMGIGIYDYFADTLSGVIRALSALLIRGDRARGLQELQLAIDHGNRARVESMIFLIEIYTTEEKKPELAIPLTEQLRKQFPRSPAMHLAQIMAYYAMQRWPDVEREAKVFLERSMESTPYYTKEGVGPGRYCLGVAAMMGRRDIRTASEQFAEILKYQDSSRWVTFALLRRGQIHDISGERAAALDDYMRVLDRPDFWGSHSEAKRCMSEPFR